MVKRHDFSPTFWIEYKDSFTSGEHLDFRSELGESYNHYKLCREIAKHILVTLFVDGQLHERNAYEAFRSLPRKKGDQIVLFILEGVNNGQWVLDDAITEEEAKKSQG